MYSENVTSGKGRRSGVTASQLRLILMGAIGALFLNNLMISTTHSRQTSEYQAHGSDLIPPEFFSKSKRLRKKRKTIKEERNRKEESTLNGGRKLLTDDDDNFGRLRSPRTLLGIFSSDNMFDASHRKWHRTLFNDVWKDDRVCTLSDFRASEDVSMRKKCQLIITFVTGASDDPNAPTERLEDSDTEETPIEFVGGYKNPVKDDINWDDVTRLNIRENMNEGKSQTWFYFGSKICKQFEETETPIDYVVKFDSDSMLKLHEFLEFAHERLPPAPYNKNTFVGALRDKGPWYHAGSKLSHPPEERGRYESHWGTQYDGVHLYLAGQCYLMSADLAAFVAEEAPFSRMRVAKGGYIEGHEDHDIAAMVYHNPSPITLITIGKSQRFWEHPVKGMPRFKKIVEREEARVSKRPFEGKILKYYTNTLR